MGFKEKLVLLLALVSTAAAQNSKNLELSVNISSLYPSFSEDYKAFCLSFNYLDDNPANDTLGSYFTVVNDSTAISERPSVQIQLKQKPTVVHTYSILPGELAYDLSGRQVRGNLVPSGVYNLRSDFGTRKLVVAK